MLTGTLECVRERDNTDVLSGKIVILQSCSFPVYLCACREKCEHLDDAGRHPGPTHTQSLGASSTAVTRCGLKKKVQKSRTGKSLIAVS